MIKKLFRRKTGCDRCNVYYDYLADKAKEFTKGNHVR